MRFKVSTICSILCVTICLGICSAIEPGDISLLKKEGMGASVLEAVEKEKIFETCALTVQDLIVLKKSGFSDKDITAYIYHRSFLKNATPRVYKNFESSRKIAEIDMQDLEHLKDIGFSDDVIKAIILKQADADENREFNKTMKMFEHMGIILDPGSKENDRHKQFNHSR